MASLLLVACGSGEGPHAWPNAWDDGVTEGCPAIPAWKVAPNGPIGVFFHSPDPGPCRWMIPAQNWDTSFDYDALGRPVAMEGIKYVYSGDFLVQGVSETNTSNVTYEPGLLISTEMYPELTPEGTVEAPSTFIVELDPRGYPRRYGSSYGSAEPLEWGLLIYADCRIVATAPEANPDEMRYVYNYDAEGHIVSMEYATDNAWAFTFDYTCWE